MMNNNVLFNPEIIEKASKTSSRLEKESILHELKSSCPSSGEILRRCLDNTIVFYQTANEDACVKLCNESQVTKIEDKYWWEEFVVLLDNMSSKKVSGNAADTAVNFLASSAPNELCARYLARIINKDLRVGISVATVNKVYQDLIQPFELSLAEAFEEKHQKWIFTHDLLVEPKLDGNRVLIIGGVGFSRNGKVYETIGHITSLLERSWPDVFKHYIIDGELMGADKFDENSGRARRKGSGSDTSLVFNIFDAIPYQEWSSKKFTTSLYERKLILKNINQSIEYYKFKTKSEENYIKFVEHKFCTVKTISELFVLRDKYIEDGYEGVMVKNLDAPYTPGRSSNVIKVKRMNDVDLIVKCVFPHRTKKNQIGGVIVDYKGCLVEVGSGWTDEQRKLYAQKPEEIIGKTIEVQYQDVTPKGSLRFPVFAGIRWDK